MRVEQAIYGEVLGRGHGLRESSFQSRIAAEIAAKLDLPDAVPAGVQAWSPFVRGFPAGDHYVIARTFLDSGASRGGMVLSHALFVSLDDIWKADSLAPLFRLLAPAIDRFSPRLTTLESEFFGSLEAPAPDLIGAANALATQQQPVVRSGVAGFEWLVDSLWQHLWPDMRRSFAFRLSFGPNDLVEQPTPAIVCTPEQLRARWTKYSVVNADDEAPASGAAAVLCGQRALAPILALATDIGVELKTVRELIRIERLHTLLSGRGEFDDLLAAIRLADGLSNLPNVGTGTKSVLLAQLTDLIPRANGKQLLLLRNLALTGFAQTEQFWSAVELTLSRLNFEPAEDTDLSNLAKVAVDSELALPSWRAAVTAGLSTAARRDGAPIYKAIWRWAEASQPAFAAILSILPSDASFERQLVDAMVTKLRVTWVEPLLGPLLKKHWFTAYGAVLASTLSPLEAARQQLKVDISSDYFDGLRSALRYASPAQMLKCAVALKDSRLVAMSADMAVEDPQVLSGIRCEDVTEQLIWSAAVGKKSSLWNAPKKPAEVRDTVLRQLLERQPVEISLLDALARTPLADLSTYPQRAQLWQLLPQREAYLQATAGGWLEAAAKDATVVTPESSLERAVIASPNLQSVLANTSVKVEAQLAIIGALTSFSEDMFITWLSNHIRGAGALSHPASEQLGTLVATRRWERAARYLADHRPDLLPALRKCASLLSIFTRWALGISTLTASEKWSAFEEVACELYPSGPDDGELWSRAGGKRSDLPGWVQNGASRWHNALYSIRVGRCPHPRELLVQMRKDFPGNEKLRLYESDSDIVGRW